METTAGCSQQCSSCDASSARCWCVECNEALCDICVSAHRRVTVTRSHQILNQPPAGHVSTPPTKFCRHHPSEPLKLYCFTCLQLTCRDCQLTAHMNHRYQFVSEALDSIRKQLDVLVQPIRAQGDTVRRNLLDMKTRLKDIADSNFLLMTELQRSYNLITQHLKRRMEDILSEVKKVFESERELIVRRMRKMKQLQQDQQSVTEIAEKARNTNDLSALQTFTAQIQSYLKNPPDQDSSPPETMSLLTVITDSVSLGAILNFGKLDIKWVPFAVTQTSNLNTPAAAATSSSSSSSTSSSSSSSSSTLPQSRTAKESSVSSVPFNCPSASSKSSSSQLSLPPSSSLSIIQSSAPVTKIAAPTFTPLVQHPSSLSHLKKNQTKMSVPVSTLGNLESVGYLVPHSAGPSPGTKLQLLNQPTAPGQNQSAAIMLNYTQALYQVSCFTLPSVVPQFCTMRTLTSATNTQDKQQKGPFSSVSVSHQVLPSATTGNKSSSQPGVTVLPSHDPKSMHQPLTDRNSSASSSQPLTPATDCFTKDKQPVPEPPGCLHPFTPLEISPHSSSLKHQQQSPVVRAVADSACDRSVQQVAVRRQEPAENEPTSTVSGDPAPAREPSAPVVSDIESAPEVTDRKAEPEPQVLETSAELVPEVSDGEAELEPGPEPEVRETKAEPEPEVSDREAELEPEPEPEVRETKAEPEPEVSDGEADSEPDSEPEPEPEVRETKAEPEPEVSDGEAEEGSSVIGYLNCSLSQWQPRVSLYRLPVSLPRPGHPLPGFRLVLGDAEDEIFLEEMSDDSQSDDDDIIEILPSSPESPVMLMMVTCSACRSSNGSVVCTACGRGYHRDCHIPPVGPHIWSEWICSLCQDLSDPSDPFSCDRPPRLQSYGLSLLDQRRCESLLLQLMVEGSAQFSQSQVMLVSKRLTSGSPSYQTPAEFLSDIWSLFKDTSQDDDVLNKLQDRLQRQWMTSLKLLPSVSSNTDGVRGAFSSNMSDTREVTEGGKGSKVTTEKKEVISSESKLRETRKRLREFLDLMETSRSKRTKADDRS
ncbi:transcription intermediary factor 1-alpha [Epinephelus fuscoguttatus]|uniref:transcription intermediary factor 1-alpha n=1 Tax=Epinephelus fuscoguttatus TaxID=293821 RepID=UPI0020D062D3|nr:transcription intermediary factor 1-alpha [Epinephelus fuscoguttatus]XP_049439248.1 transcription intermediary factor 1-alpha [Epinephelus fuscoguttatus]XP_049439249.1 transcription intermediary factor 1-alpha [Epinephelus fuscoguttatus]XP_049439250.1 transcription intermediary factor 1-alpha [Epinephelus fuscoguttatus]XP_049439251.1 transcription intermediary factor 1-alpha [Epinephelus fuscoguttatus]